MSLWHETFSFLREVTERASLSDKNILEQKSFVFILTEFMRRQQRRIESFLINPHSLEVLELASEVATNLLEVDHSQTMQPVVE